jgi:hypothetical protein
MPPMPERSAFRIQILQHVWHTSSSKEPAGSSEQSTCKLSRAQDGAVQNR